MQESHAIFSHENGSVVQACITVVRETILVANENISIVYENSFHESFKKIDREL